MNKRIKIYGERNTNTNYLQKLLALNLRVEQVPGTVPSYVQRLEDLLPGREFVRDFYFSAFYRRTLGWKHARVNKRASLEKVPIVDGDLSFVSITKNPYSWLLSLYRNPYHQYYKSKPCFEKFLQRTWKVLRRDNVKGDLSSPIDLWNIKNRSYLNLEGFQSVNLTSEGIFDNPEGVIDSIASAFDIEKKQRKFVHHDRSTKGENKNTSYYRDYYLGEKWRADLSSEAIDLINESIDMDLMNYFGYSVIE